MAGRGPRLYWIAPIMVAGVIVCALYALFGTQWAASEPAEDALPALAVTAPAAPAAPAAKPLPAKQPPADAAAAPQESPPPPAETRPAAPGRAQEALRQGEAALAGGNLVSARALLSEALASGSLGPQPAAQCRQRLTEITQKVVFGREIYPDDPYSRRYVVQPGDTLGTIVEREGLLVPWEGIKRINRIQDERLLRAGQWIKLVQGPFDAIVTKSSFTLDLYHHGMFLKSYRIGLGQNGSTPTGRWIVRPGGRVERAPWTPPAGTGRTGTIEFGQPDYPLGPKGLWIALEGVEPRTEMLVGFGIHGTNEPDSIGRQASLGCIRLGDEDIEELFGLLYGGKSRIEVRP